MVGEHEERFSYVVSIYKFAMVAHELTPPILVILSKIETKVKAHIAWDPKWNTLTWFCGPKEDHLYHTSFNLVVVVEWEVGPKV